jgi:hypothetical protein
MGLDFKSQRFDVEWHAENLLASAHYGPYRTAQVVLSVVGVSGFAGSGQLEVDPGEVVGIEFIEYMPSRYGPGAIRLVFTTSGEVSLSGTSCELRYSVLTR